MFCFCGGGGLGDLDGREVGGRRDGGETDRRGGARNLRDGDIDLAAGEHILRKGGDGDRLGEMRARCCEGDTDLLGEIRALCFGGVTDTLGDERVLNCGGVADLRGDMRILGC